MKVRKLLILVLALMVCFVFSSGAFADDSDPDYYEYVNKMNLDKTYNFPGTFKKYNDFIYFNEINVPAKGVVTLTWKATTIWEESEEGYIFVVTDLNNPDSTSKFEGIVDLKYNKDQDLYMYVKRLTLPAGKYYIVYEPFSYYDSLDREYQFNSTAYYKPVFGNASIGSIKARRKGFTVKINKASAATGYQIKYSRSAKMTRAKTVTTTKLIRTISKLKAKKKYYVQVRSYKRVKVNGKIKTYYSPWSAKKAVKTR